MSDKLLDATPPLHIWLLFALEYLNLGRDQDFVAILERTQRPDVSQKYEDGDEKLCVLNTLAAYYVGQASVERNLRERDDALGEVTKWINRANRIENNSLSQTISAFSYLVADKPVEMVDMYLKGASEDTFAILLVKAALAYNKADYQEALRLYARALRTNPDCSASVRFGLGLCYYKLDRRDVAEKCFLRALELDSSLVEPRIALAVLKLNSGDLAQVQPAMKLLQEAYALDNQHPRVLTFLADHYSYRRDYGKVLKLAEMAKSSLDPLAPRNHSAGWRSTLSETEFQLGRVRHAQGDLDAAMTHYEEAVKNDADNALAQFGMAQVLLHRRQMHECIEALEQVAKRYPDDAATLRFYGTVLAREGRVEEAKEVLQRAVDADATDPDTLIEFAQLLERLDAPKSLVAYRTALRLLKSQDVDTDEHLDLCRSLRNNVAVMYHRVGNLVESLAMFQEVFCGGPDEPVASVVPQEAVAKSVTITFNLARVHEDMNRPDLAKQLYLAILEAHPTYTDCYLRLACLDRAVGNTDGALQHLHHALTVHPDLPEALALQGLIFFDRREYHPAQLKFERVLEKVDRHDPYALIALGNIYYMARFEHKDRKDRYMKHAADSFYRVLSADNTSLYAANGLGMVFAEEGRLGAAAEIFSKVREGTNALPDVLVNLAHIYLARGEFQKAITLYENALRKYFANSDATPKLILYLARAYFEAGDYENAETQMQRCIRLWPAKDALWFNMALIKEARAAQKLQGSDEIPEHVVDNMILQAQEAKRIFQTVCEAYKQKTRAARREKKAAAKKKAAEEAGRQGEEQNNEEEDKEGGEEEELEEEDDEEEADAAGGNAKKAQDHVIRCDDILAKAQQVKQRAAQTKEEMVARLREVEERRLQRQREKEEAERSRKEAEEHRARELAEIAEKDMVVLREEVIHWKPLEQSTSQAAPKKKSSSKRQVQREAPADEAPLEKKPKRKAASRVESAPSSGVSVQSSRARKEEEVVEYEEEEDDGLEEWQREMMNSKMHALEQSKREREQKDKQKSHPKRARGESSVLARASSVLEAVEEDVVRGAEGEAAPASAEVGDAPNTASGGGLDDDDLVLNDDE